MIYLRYKKSERKITMKKFLSIILAMMMILSTFTFVMADDGIKITIDGEAKTFDVMPQIIDGRTLVPMRAIFESLGAEVGWDDATKTATGKTATTTVSLTIDKKAAKVNNKVIALDVAAQIIEGRTMVPARFVAESLGCKVDWDGNTKTVIISKDAGNTEETPKTEAPAPVEGTKLAVVSFENNSPAPSTAINFWGKTADNKNINNSFAYVNYSDVASIGKPNSDDDFGNSLVKADVSLGKDASVKGIYEGRVNDIPAEMMNFKEGRKYTMYMWVYLAETANGGNSAKVSFRAYANTNADGFKSAKTLTFKKGEWTRLQIEFTAKAEHEGATTGVRMTFTPVAEGDFPTVMYFDNLTFVGDPEGTSAPAPATKEEEKKEETKTEAPAPSVGTEKILDPTLPQTGTVIITQKDLLTAVNNKTTKEVDGALQVTVSPKPSSDTGVTAMSKTAISGLIKQGNVYMLTFKARLISGDPYIKAYVQGNDTANYAKSVFAATSYDKEWTTCYMPFVGRKEDMVAFGFRFGGAEHVSEIKDLQIIDYGTSVKVTDLPHTYIVVGNTSVSGVKLQ
ncbi:MAG: copper amine oxidase N-terminal domain-containing protein [Ruminococcaceae bacterium]|nr:copper amine oxidase N-terminal domain-containing protein [Oscillospiraceae bacterium]